MYGLLILVSLSHYNVVFVLSSPVLCDTLLTDFHIILDRFQEIPSLQSASKGYFPFAYGQRVCIGMNMANIQSIVALSMLLQKYTFVEEKSYRPKFTLSLSLTTTNGVKVWLKQDEE